MAYRISVQPSFEPLTLVDIKSHLRVEHNEEDSLISLYAQSAREEVERGASLILATQEIEQYQDGFGCGAIEMEVWPVTSIDEVAVLINGVYQPVSEANYIVDLLSRPTRITPKAGTTGWPGHDRSPNAVRIKATVGDDQASIPAAAKVAILLLVGFRYETREDIPISETNNPKVRSAMSLIRNLRY